MKLLSLSLLILFSTFRQWGGQEVDLAHKWQITWCGFASFVPEYEKFSEEEKATYRKKIKKAFIRFRSNQTYSMQVFDAQDSGSWVIQKNMLLLKSKQGVNIEFLVEKNAKRAFTLYNVQQKDTLLVRIKR